jgi:prevent-host-death family protein
VPVLTVFSSEPDIAGAEPWPRWRSRNSKGGFGATGQDDYGVALGLGLSLQDLGYMDFPHMKTVNIHEAKTHLSRLIDRAAKGEPFVIAKAGKPMVKVTAVETAPLRQRRTGFLKGQIKVPDDFDRMGSNEIEEMFDLHP